jgi:hypothetical protein
MVAMVAAMVARCLANGYLGTCCRRAASLLYEAECSEDSRAVFRTEEIRAVFRRIEGVRRRGANSDMS